MKPTQRREMPSALRELAIERGVTLAYVDGRDIARVADPEVLLAVVNAFDDLDTMRSPSDARSALRQYRKQKAERMLEPVYVVDEGVEASVSMQVARRSTTLECRIEFEFGGEVGWTVRTGELIVAKPRSGNDDEAGRVLLRLPAMRVGYHRLRVIAGRRSATSTLVVRPLRGARGRFARDWRAFSVQAPVFSLHSQRSWGAGDVGDLADFARLTANQNASVVSTLPLLATFGPEDFEASPYRPVSRRFWSDRWIALDRVEALKGSVVAQRLMRETYPEALRATWVTNGLIDGAAAFAAKRDVVQAFVATQSDFMDHDDGGLRSYVIENPDANDYARFRAAGERFGLDWRQWPSTTRSGLLRWNDVDPTIVRYHLFAQWMIDQQMRTLASSLSQRGQTLGLDIPVGVHPHGYDVWRNPEQYIHGVSVGAPPDDLTVRGQNWNAPPAHPERSRDDAHNEFRLALRFHMRVAGVVRIDHVMGLQRMFWVPDGVSPEEGLYVTMPFEEMLAIVAIEAQRMGVDVVGEDLGTVHDDLRDAMEREGIRRTYVAQFAIRSDDEQLETVPSGSVASFATHDTPTFFGWWHSGDIDERLELGLLDEGQAQVARLRRAQLRTALVAALELDESEASDPPTVLAGLHARLALSDAGLVMAQLDDLLGEDVQVNMPGTSSERPNWNRRARLSNEDLSSTTVLAEALAPLRRHRGYASTTALTKSAADTRRGTVTRFSANDLHLFNEGRHYRLHEHLGCHPMIADGVAGCYFALWAPNAEKVSVIGDFNAWDAARHPLAPRENSGVWETFVPGASELDAYKFRLRSRLGGDEFDKTDPYGRLFELSPATAAKVWRSTFEWSDDAWLDQRRTFDSIESPMSIYEVHLGSWRRIPEEGNRQLTYRELAPLLVEHVTTLGFTHVEILPVMEHPFYGSWGYQTTGYFAPTSRMGSPDDFKFLVDELHRANVGVILDWVPSHFPADDFALARFDGTYLYEHADERQRVHPDWQSWTFNYGRNEVRSFLVSNACFWLEEYHVDGLRLDAVASMLYLDYSRKPGEWIPNQWGGHEDLEAVEFLRQCTTEMTTSFPGVVAIAEESTAWPNVTRPAAEGGLGFSYKWDLGWMHDTLDYLHRDPIYRRHHHNQLTFRGVYAWDEEWVLPLSHDEVVHGKGSLLEKMPGDDWQKRANLRLLLGYQYAMPGKKLLFMGAEFAQYNEWNHDASLDWHLMDDPSHAGVATWLAVLNDLYRTSASLHRDDRRWEGFEWISCDDADQSVLVWRRGVGDDELVVCANFTPVPREHYEVSVGSDQSWRVLANSDDVAYGGSGFLTHDEFTSSDSTLRLTLPPLALVVLGRR